MQSLDPASCFLKHWTQKPMGEVFSGFIVGSDQIPMKKGHRASRAMPQLLQQKLETVQAACTPTLPMAGD